MAKLFQLGLQNIDLWRSEEMQLVQLIVPADSAHDTITALGQIGLLQFKDLNTERSAFQRNFANQVKRCDEMARRLRFLHEQVDKAKLAIPPRNAFAKVVTMDELEGQLESLENEVLQVNSNNERLVRTRAELTELQLLLARGSQFFDSAGQRAIQDTVPATGSQADMQAPLLDREAGPAYADKGRLGCVAGLIAQDKLMGFERLLFRATRGNVFVKAAPVGAVLDPATGDKIEKCVFVVFMSGERARHKVNKICEAFSANRYPLPEEPLRQRQAAAEVEQRLGELSATISAGEALRQGVLQQLANNLDQWTTLVRSEKAVYHTLNKMSMDHSRKVLVAEAWVPSAARAQVSEVLRMAAQQSSDSEVGTVVQHLSARNESPPTYFKTNKFTECFQAIVEAYGVARYREVNPAVYSIMTFPFLFAVMFGDFGHGVLMLLFALFLLVNEKKLMKSQLDDMSSMAFGGRYCILLMSLYSIYTGALYNEFFAMPMTLAGPTHWQCPVPDNDWLHACKEKLVQRGDGPYPFGVDPAWRGTKTELPYLNSMKMKMSIIMGVTHMNLGILMSLFNNLYFRDALSIWAEFVPQMIFLNGLFGYLSFLIIFKWVTGSTADLYHVLITMFLNPGTVDEQAYLFPYQSQVQTVLLLAALVAVPCMLFPKPLILNARHKAAHAGSDGEYGTLEGGEQHGGGGGGGGGHGGDHGHGEFDFGEVFVHQMIHTIEFVLGAVSNTASYLRLWALSLAHSQLSGVFYERVLMGAMQSGSVPAMVIAFFVWAMATLGVLMVMESLSAFLHALRLHWVEFMNKFYKGDGYLFTPLDLHKAAAEQDA